MGQAMAGTQPSGNKEIKELSNEELALRTQEGSPECFEELVKRFEGRLLGFLGRRGGQAQEAEDLLQDTFVRAYHKIEQYHPKWRFSTWLFTIARRLAYDRRKKLDRQSLEQAEAATTDQYNPLRIVSDKEEKENLWSLANELLSKDQFTALWLKYSEDMSIKEIAKIMNKTQSYVKVLLFRARNRLAVNLKPNAVSKRASMPKPHLGTGGI